MASEGKAEGTNPHIPTIQSAGLPTLIKAPCPSFNCDNGAIWRKLVPITIKFEETKLEPIRCDAETATSQQR